MDFNFLFRSEINSSLLTLLPQTFLEHPGVLLFSQFCVCVYVCVCQNFTPCSGTKLIVDNLGEGWSWVG